MEGNYIVVKDENLGRHVPEEIVNIDKALNVHPKSIEIREPAKDENMYALIHFEPVELFVPELYVYMVHKDVKTEGVLYFDSLEDYMKHRNVTLPYACSIDPYVPLHQWGVVVYTPSPVCSDLKVLSATAMDDLSGLHAYIRDTVKSALKKEIKRLEKMSK